MISQHSSLLLHRIYHHCYQKTICLIRDYPVDWVEILFVLFTAIFSLNVCCRELVYE